MFVRTRQPFAAVIAVMLVALASAGLSACSHRSYQDAPPAADESVAGQMLGARPWSGPTHGSLGSIVGGQQLYPLAIGNRWDYAVHTRTTLVTSDGPQPPQFDDSPLRAEIVGTMLAGARTYFLQQEGNPLLSGPFYQASFPMRQDRSGLYEADLPHAYDRSSAVAAEGAGRVFAPAAIRSYVDRLVVRPAERAAFQRAAERVAAQVASARRHSLAIGGQRGGPDAGELSQLRYPLTPGAHWVVLESPRFSRVVMGRERVIVPAGAFIAWNLRGASELYGPRDSVQFWYSNAGLIRIRVHIESDATDPSGNVLGRVVGDLDQVLTALTLFDPNAPHALAVSP